MNTLSLKAENTNTRIIDKGKSINYNHSEAYWRKRVDSMKKVFVVLLVVSMLLGISSYCFAYQNLYGFFASHVCTAVYSCDYGSTATDIIMGAEGIHHNPVTGKNVSDGAKTAKYRACYSGQAKKCNYFNLLSTYGYVTIGGKGDDGVYHRYKGYVH